MTDPTPVVEQLFESNSLTDDPIFVAWLSERTTVTHADADGLETTQSRVEFAFFEPGELGVLTAHSEERGDLRRLIDHCCQHFGVQQVAFLNVISARLADVLDGFEETTRTIGGHPMDCLEGTWRLDGE